MSAFAAFFKVVFHKKLKLSSILGFEFNYSP